MSETQPNHQQTNVPVRIEGALYNVDVHGQAHKPEGSGSQSGDFLSNAHREAIDANEELIRNHMPAREAEKVVSAGDDAGTPPISLELSEADTVTSRPPEYYDKFVSSILPDLKQIHGIVNGIYESQGGGDDVISFDLRQAQRKALQEIGFEDMVVDSLSDQELCLIMRRADELEQLEGQNGESVDDLADAIERGDVTPEESATKMAELTAHIAEVTAERDALAEKVTSLEAETRELNDKLTKILEKLDQMGIDTSEMGDDKPVLSDEESIALGDAILERLGREPGSSDPEALTAEEQAALQKRMEEEGDAESDNSTEEDQKTPEQYFNEQLESTRDKYAELTAKDRLSYLGRFMKSNGLLSRAVRRIPGVSGMLDNLNSSSSKAKDIEEARANYEIALREMEDFVTGTAEVEGKTIEEIRLGATLLQIREEHQLTLGIHDHQMKMGKDGNGFTGWWVRHNGIGGTIVKSGIILTASLATGGLAGGIAAGIFGAAAAAGIAGGAAGALTGGGIAKYVHDRRARSIIDKDLNRTVAERDRRQDHATMYNERNGTPNETLAVQGDAIAAGEAREPRRAAGPDWVRRMTGVIEARTDKIVRENRGEMARSIVMGASAGAAAGVNAGNWVDAALHPGAQHSLVDAQPTTDAHPNEGTLPDQRYDEMLKGHEFKVEPGNSVIEEIKQAAHMNGHDISMHRAEEIYNHIYENVGDKIINGGPEYHGPSGDIRFGESGMYGWGKGVLQQIVNLSGK